MKRKLPVEHYYVEDVSLNILPPHSTQVIQKTLHFK